jgi:hypothetical protein
MARDREVAFQMRCACETQRKPSAFPTFPRVDGLLGAYRGSHIDDVDARPKSPKIRGKPTDSIGGCPKNNRFPIGGPPRDVGVLPRISTHLILSGIIPKGIKYMVDYKPIGL